MNILSQLKVMAADGSSQRQSCAWHLCLAPLIRECSRSFCCWPHKCVYTSCKCWWRECFNFRSQVAMLGH